jgi:hypothetical protein
MRRLAHIAVVTALAVGPLLAPVGPLAPAGAQVTGGCSATIAGQDVGAATSARSAIEVGADETVTVAGTAPGPITGYEVFLSFAGVRFPAAEGEVTDGSTSYSTEVDVADYARYGVGLYRVEAETTGTVCSTWAYVNVTGKSPLTTAAGVAGSVMVVGGLFGMIRAALRRGPTGVRP